MFYEFRIYRINVCFFPSQLNIEYLKIANGYRPFLYNSTASFCDITKDSRKFPVLNILINIILNIKHTCPYDVSIWEINSQLNKILREYFFSKQQDNEVKRLVLRDNMLRLLPLLSGVYLINFHVAIYNHWKPFWKCTSWFHNISDSISINGLNSIQSYVWCLVLYLYTRAVEHQ